MTEFYKGEIAKVEKALHDTDALDFKTYDKLLRILGQLQFVAMDTVDNRFSDTVDFVDKVDEGTADKVDVKTEPYEADNPFPESITETVAEVKDSVAKVDEVAEVKYGESNAHLVRTALAEARRNGVDIAEMLKTINPNAKTFKDVDPADYDKLMKELGAY